MWPVATVAAFAGGPDVPGLYFVGLPWLHTQGSGLLHGVGDDAEHVTDHLLARLEQSPTSV